MNIRVLAVSAALLALAAGAAAQSGSGNRTGRSQPAQQTAAKLKVGDKAPSLSIEEWIKGDKVASFEAGKVYVVEFWATWCPPCIASIPHLTETQKKHKDNGLTVIGVASSERGSSRKARLDTLKKFVTDRGSEMEYVVGYDDDRSMSRSWLQAAGQNGIPTAFIVGHDGKIAWIGNPLGGFDKAVEKAMAAAKKAGGQPKADAGEPMIRLASFQQPAAEAAKKDEAKKEAKADEGPTLVLGDTAPPLAVSSWVKGEPVTGFEKGKVYVVEFWATWCGPCKVSIPHLTELQKKHKDVAFIGVSVWENNQGDVEPFVKEMGDQMGYRVAMDQVAPPTADTRQARREAARNGMMAQTWMQASGSRGIPTAFIVDRDGKVAWIGHPMRMDEPLEQIIAGTWDLKAKAAERRSELETERKITPYMRAYADASNKGDHAAALSALDSILEIQPNNLGAAGSKFHLMLDQMGDPARAYAYAATLVEGPAKNDAGTLNEIAWTIVDPEAKRTTKDLAVALKAAERANELTKNKDPMILDTLARVYHDMGDMAKALATQELAVKHGAGSGVEEELKARLDEYTKAKTASKGK